MKKLSLEADTLAVESVEPLKAVAPQAGGPTQYPYNTCGNPPRWEVDGALRTTYKCCV